MNRYSNYNPEIPYVDETPAPETGAELPKAPAPADTGKKGAGKKQKPKAKPAKEQKPENSVSIAEYAKKWANGTTVRLLTGIALGGFGIYLCVAFISYLATCFKDQAAINHSAVGQAVGIANAGGEGGARISEFLINECFGLGSFVLLIWLIAMSLKLLTGKPRFKSVNFTIKCLVALITVSLIIGLVTIGANSTVNWGGYHGRYVNEFIIHFVGWPGAVILCVMLIATFVVICLRDLINWIMRIRKARAERRRIIDEEKAKRLEEERIIEEMRQQEERDEAAASADSYVLEDEPDPAQAEAPFDFSATENPELYALPDEPEEPAFADGIGESPLSDSSDSSDKSDSSDSSDLSDSSERFDSSDSSDLSDSSDKSANSDSDPLSGPMTVNVGEVSQGTSRPSNHVEDDLCKHYHFPPLQLLKPGESKIAVDAQEQMENKEQIRKTLLEFGFPIVDIEATVGPTVTLYEVKPDKGQKVSKIKGLVDDISLSLAATGVRIIAPIPGKGTIGIEVANKDPQLVSMRTVIQSNKYQQSNFKLPVALGNMINNDVFIADLAKMPHMLVAGATGQGKSVGLNVIITSLLYRKKPHELKFVMIDPKMVEFSIYSKIEKHYLAKMPGEEKAIITDMAKAVATLNSVVQEMEDRYKLLEKAGCRKVEEYNRKWHDRLLNPEEGHRFMPYIVVIIDEFCDLIMTQGKEVEKPIARIAQKARAVGIHEIIATQRPSTTVITGNIKANFLTRVAFKVSSGYDSKTIIDTPGAEQLIGMGDMLIQYNSEMTRLQCAFVDTPEVEAIVDHISRQAYNSGPYMLPEPKMTGEGGAPGEGGDFGGEHDSMLREIGMYVVQSGYASTSNIQRKYSIGYNRAGKIMDQLEQMGIVSPSQGGKPRQVLMQPSEAVEVLNNL